MAISRINPSEISRLECLVNSYPFHPYREHKIFDQQEVRALALDKVMCQIKNSISALHCAGPEGDALAIIEWQQWDTGHFGFPNYRIRLFQSPDVTADSLAELVATASMDIRNRHKRFNIAIETDEYDFQQNNAVIMQGFKLRDSKRIYVARNVGVKSGSAVKQLYYCREFREKDKAESLKLLQDISFPSRFTRDPCFPANKVADMYRIWTEKLLRPPYHNRPVLVVENSRHEIIAVGTGQDIDLGERYDIKTLCGDGLFFSNPLFPGSYISFLQHLRAESIMNYKAFELVVSATNLAAIRALEKTGFMSTPGRYSFHLNDCS